MECGPQPRGTSIMVIVLLARLSIRQLSSLSF
jgi:hypothetical protein